MNGLTRLGWRDVAAMISIVLCFSTNLLELFFELFQVFVRKLFKIHKFISRAFDGAKELIQFEVDRFGVAVLRILDQKHHEEGHDGRGGIDDQLPGIGKMKRWAGQNPHKDDEHSSGKSPGASEGYRGTAGEDAKCVAYHAKEIPLLFLLLYLFNLSFQSTSL